ncbi:Tapetum determinant 1 [Heracleum sosnowskyi]|uniref:Tapetum determinant 1 n=1 Tax=Heracleum sosnowskyi TaxID=360622 RepID=A0AAD8MNQ3_9APIA|nr:Tapetum determinant 1 [Heracleum sosnowskyi]
MSEKSSYLPVQEEAQVKPPSAKELIVNDDCVAFDDPPPTDKKGPRSWCSKSSIDVFQGQTAPLPSGIPTYTVTVKNICDTGCTISNIHLSYGWFSSLRTINPSVFRRLSYNDCLVNDGKPLGPRKTITFQYANTFSYPLPVSSITCI